MALPMLQTEEKELYGLSRMVPDLDPDKPDPDPDKPDLDPVAAGSAGSRK